MTARRTISKEWWWPTVAEALDIDGIFPIKKYIQRRQAIAEVQVSCRPIYDLCTGVDRVPGTSRFMRLWDQDVEQELE